MIRVVTAFQFTVLFLLITNAVVWFFSSDSFCKTILCNGDARIYKRDVTMEKRNLKTLSLIMARINRSELVIDKLLSQFPVRNLRQDFPIIYGITPTYARPTQKADLTKLCQTLRHVPNFHWIVIEDSEFKTDLVSRFLQRCGVVYTHLSVGTSLRLQRTENDAPWKYPRGMEQRNVALQWIRSHFDANKNKGVVYFVDDDNAYDLEIFNQMRYTKGVSVWPVGLVGGLRWEGPLCEKNKVVGFRTAFKPQRNIPMDMAGFAINAKLIVDNPNHKFDLNGRVRIGFSESVFLSKIVKRDDLEPLADQCTKVLVWHTRTTKANFHREVLLGRNIYPQMEI